MATAVHAHAGHLVQAAAANALPAASTTPATGLAAPETEAQPPTPARGLPIAGWMALPADLQAHVLSCVDTHATPCPWIPLGRSHHALRRCVQQTSAAPEASRTAWTWQARRRSDLAAARDLWPATCGLRVPNSCVPCSHLRRRAARPGAPRPARSRHTCLVGRALAAGLLYCTSRRCSATSPKRPKTSLHSPPRAGQLGPSTRRVATASGERRSATVSRSAEVRSIGTGGRCRQGHTLPLAAPKLGSCASSRLWVAKHSWQEELGRWGPKSLVCSSEPRPRSPRPRPLTFRSTGLDMHAMLQPCHTCGLRVLASGRPHSTCIAA